MRIHAKFIVAVTVFAVIVIFYASLKTAVDVKREILSANHHEAAKKTPTNISIWVSVTKIDRGHLLSKFHKFFKSLVGQRGKCRAVFELNVITDATSRPTVDGVINKFIKQYKETLFTVKFLIIVVSSISSNLFYWVWWFLVGLP